MEFEEWSHRGESVYAKVSGVFTMNRIDQSKPCNYDTVFIII